MKGIIIACFISLLIVFDAFAEKKEPGVKQRNDIMATLSCFAYGYKVSVKISGVATSIKGGKSESIRLFNKDHEMMQSASPEMRKLFILKSGENRIQVEFKKTGKAIDRLTLSLEIENYPAPVFLLYSAKKPEGKINKVVIIEKNVPTNFKPVYFSDEGENRSAFVHVSSMDAAVTPFLNGVRGMTLSGMPGSIPLDGVKPGKNQLVIKYTASPQAGRFKFAVVTPEWVKFFNRNITDQSEKEETFSFNVK
ncbi:MAG: hypothetical protein A2W19_03325 [Spirochaetes bacterium RBG_16_49_21]|nr:MAG: hypothetical protein A2W19_03325 [Spirochaetes bacterium RBG_16_49_21]